MEPRSETAPRARYRIDQLRGRGAAGSVHQAWDRDLDRAVALKFLHDDRPEHRARMRREARAQARIDHPNVCRIFDVGEDGDRLYIAMQWIDGKDLDAVASRLSLEQKVAVIRDVATAVHVAHTQQIIHRDLKPANILVEIRDDGTIHPFVVDFGLARAIDEPGATATGEIVGTPQYLAPEQAWGLPVDRRSDVYSLGATLYHILAGRPPYAGDSATDVLVQVISGAPPPLERVAPSIPTDLAIIVGKCMRKEPEGRYESARAIAEDLDRWLRGEPILARPPGLFERTWAAAKRHKAVAAAVVATALTLSAIAGAWIHALRSEREEREVTARLEEQVRYIERLLEHERSLPLHDMRTATARAARAIALLSADTASKEFPAPLAYAEGRSRLAAGEIGPAVAALQRAWDEGLRTPAVGYHLGAAITQQLGSALADAERISDDVLREARKAELRTQSRRLALPPLQQARGYAEEPATLIETRIAAAEGKSERAIALAREVLARYPWSNDARYLEADLLFETSGRQRKAGQYREASTTIERARRVFEDARRLAPSDVRALEGICRCAERRLHIASDGGGDQRALFEAARQACEAVLTADPEHVPAMLSLSSAWTRYAFFLLERGGEAAGARARQQAIAMAEAALRVAPGDAAALVQAGAAWYWSPHADAPRVVAYMRRAVKADPGSVDARQGLGRALLRLHDHLHASGSRDLRPVIEEAIATYREVIRREPRYLQAYGNLGYALNHLADYEENSGRDPEPHYRAMLALLDPALLAAHLESASLRVVAALASHRIARLQVWRGVDASSEIQRGLALANDAIRIRPSMSTFHARMQMHILRAYAASDVETRREALAAADADLRRIEQLAGKEHWWRIDWYLARVQLRVEPASAERDLQRAVTAIDDFAREWVDNRWLTEIFLARAELTRCEVLGRCRAGKAEEHFRAALASTPWAASEVARARREIELAR